MKLLYIFIASFINLIPFDSLAQLSGKVCNSKGEPIPYATVYIKETMHGTATDDKGRFTLNISKGEYNIIFQSIGHKTKLKTISIQEKPVKLEILLDDAVYELSEVVVSNKNNPADRIMRKAISNGQVYKNRVKSFTSDVYFKSNLKVTKLAAIIKLIAPKDVKLPTVGKQYTMEMVSRIYYNSPEEYKQRTLSMRTNFPSNSFEIPGIGLFRENIYNSRFFETASPLGSKAFTFYRYTLLGSWQEDGATIFKIGIVPRKNSGTYFNGIIYIKDNSYEITNAELKTKVMDINYIFNLNFDMVKDMAPLPTSITAKMNGSLLGNDFAIGMTASAKYSEMVGIAAPKSSQQTNTIAVAPIKKQVKKNASKKREEIENQLEELNRKDNISLGEMKKMVALSNRLEEMDDTSSSKEYKLIKVEKDSLFNTQDSTYWAKIRPIPLSEEELKYSHESDSITATIQKGAAAPKDTTRNKIKWKPLAILTGGNIYARNDTKFSSSGLLNNKHSYFNPVDGFTIGNTFEYSTLADSNKLLSLSITPAYAFTRKELMLTGEAKYDFSPHRKGIFSIRGGATTQDFNAQNPVNPLFNTIAALYFKENYKKVVDTRQISINGTIEVVNGLNMSISALYSKRLYVENNTNYSFFKRKEQYSGNTPNNPFLNQYPLVDAKQATVRTSISYQPSPRYYYNRQGYKQYIPDQKPIFELIWEQGLSALSSNSRFSHIQLGLRNEQQVHLFNTLKYHVTAGTFFNNSRLQMPDFYYPQTAYLPVTQGNSTMLFRLLPYYKYATPESYAEAHVTYEANSLILKHLPFLSKKIFNEYLSVGYYTMKHLRNYTEIGYGLNGLFLIGAVGISARFEDGKYTGWGVNAFINLGR